MIGHADFHILLALFDADRHGYGIMKEVTRITDAALNLGPGTLYGAIRRLLAAGLIEDDDESLLEDRASAYIRLAGVLWEIGSGAESAAVRVKAIAFLEQLNERHPHAGPYLGEIALQHLVLGDIYYKLDRVELAEDAYSSSLQSISDAVNDAPNSASCATRLATVLSAVAKHYQRTSRSEQAETLSTAQFIRDRL